MIAQKNLQKTTIETFQLTVIEIFFKNGQRVIPITDHTKKFIITDLENTVDLEKNLSKQTKNLSSMITSK